ncbi:type II toxin-antitoxin system toxin TscT [Staphylococcus simulans]|uniref:type II toxin-antitoxin system toxin TscT n=1 Tax=Staphylococcus simulans TaxID=1286 RepID=UPI003F812934
MNFKIANLLNEIEIIKGKFEDLAQTHAWYGEDIFKYEDMPKTKEQLLLYAHSYKEANIHHEQTLDLMYYYLSEFDEVIQKFHEIEKASSAKSANGTDNA